MGVLEALRIHPESDEEYPQESGTEFDREPDDEFDENADPQPGHTAPRAKTRARQAISQVRESAPRVTKRAKEEAASEIESMLAVIALGWGWQAPECADALEQAAPAFAERLVKILARNPRWLQRVRDGGLIADIVQLCGTLAPVVKVAYTHYTTPREDSSHGGVVFDPAQFQPYDGNGFSRAG